MHAVSTDTVRRDTRVRAARALRPAAEEHRLPGIVGLQSSAGNAAVVQMLRGPASAARPDIEREVSPAIMDRLQLAVDAVRHTRSVIDGAGNQIRDLKASKFNSFMRMAVMRNDAFWDTSRLLGTPDAGTLTAAKAAYARGGNCTEYSDVAYAYLRKYAHGQIVRKVALRDGDHVFVLLGDPQEPSSDWVVADAWPTRAKACMWDEHFAHTSRDGLRTYETVRADGRSNVEYVRNHISLNRAGRFVADWDLTDLHEWGMRGVASALGLRGRVTLDNILDALQDFARTPKNGLDHWPTDKLRLLCLSIIDPAVVARTIQMDSVSSMTIGEGIEDAQDEGRLAGLQDQPTSTADGRRRRYFSQ